MSRALGPRIVSLWDMLEINASAFIEAATELRRLNTIMETDPTSGGKDNINPELRALLLGTLDNVIAAINAVGARAAGISAYRLHAALSNAEGICTFDQLKDAMRDIELRFKDEVSFIKLFVIDTNATGLFGGAPQLLGERTANAFPSAWFDVEESAKCLALGRGTATVFHAMRVIEIGIRAFARRLDIPDPTAPAERNWGNILREIKKAIDTKFPSSTRLPGSEGAFLEDLYVTMDAIKNPWRNATMHVEGVYTEQEAQHIAICVGAFIGKMSMGFDENGDDFQPELALPET